MTSEENTTAVPPGVAMELNGHVLEPESQMPGGHLFQETASSTNYVIIQFAKLPSVEREQELKDLQVEFCQLIPPSTWLVKFEPHDLSPIRQLPYVLCANPYHESLSLNPLWLAELQESTQSPRLLMTESLGPQPASQTERHKVVIMLHVRSRSPDQMRDHLISNYGIDPEKVYIGLIGLRASLSAPEIIRISKIDDVSGIYPESRDRLGSHLMREIVHAREARATQQRNLGLAADQDLDGKDQVIAIADSGLDNGNSKNSLFSSVHPFFSPARIYLLDPRSEDDGLTFWGTHTSRKGQVNDLMGHGTHVAGVALGSYNKLESQDAIRAEGGCLQGVAPGASLVMQAVTGCPSWDDNDQYIKPGVELKPEPLAREKLYLDPYYGYPTGYTLSGARSLTVTPTPDAQYAWRARIHSNSYSPEPVPGNCGYRPGGYFMDSLTYKVRDYTILFCAGNEGDDRTFAFQFPLDSGQITAWPSAKNVLTVGACYNNQYVRFRPPERKLYRGYQGPQEGGDIVYANCIPRFSNRGPTASMAPAHSPHRYIIKPDVVAPGVAVYSAKSRDLVNGAADPVGVAPKPNKYCQFMSGTSASTPVVAGAVALLRQALARRGHTTPSAALLKALIVNGAKDLSTDQPPGATRPGCIWRGNTTALGGTNHLIEQALGPAPDDAQGWGRLDINESMDIATDTANCGFRDVFYNPSQPDERLRPDQQPVPDQFSISVPLAADSTNPGFKANLKVTLAWTDLPGEGLQNQLSLHINFDKEPWKSKHDVEVDVSGKGPLPSLIRMARNNVQKLEVRGIEIPNGQIVDAKVVVRAESIVEDPDTNKKERQDYALVWKVWYGSG